MLKNKLTLTRDYTMLRFGHITSHLLLCFVFKKILCILGKISVDSGSQRQQCFSFMRSHGSV